MPAPPSNGFLNTQPDLSLGSSLALYSTEVEMLPVSVFVLTGERLYDKCK